METLRCCKCYEIIIVTVFENWLRLLNSENLLLFLISKTTIHEPGLSQFS